MSEPAPVTSRRYVSWKGGALGAGRLSKRTTSKERAFKMNDILCPDAGVMARRAQLPLPSGSAPSGNGVSGSLVMV